MSSDIFTKETLMHTEEVKGAINTIKKLSKYYDVYIITARTEELILQVKDWLIKNELQDYITDIFSSSWEEKQDICLRNNINFLCDDDKRHLEKEKIRNRILFSEATDFLNHSDLEVVNSWNQLENRLL